MEIIFVHNGQRNGEPTPPCLELSCQSRRIDSPREILRKEYNIGICCQYYQERVSEGKEREGKKPNQREGE